MTEGLGAHSVIEAVGTQESMMQAIAPPVPAGTSASSGWLTAWRCQGWNCSLPKFTCSAVLLRSAAYLPELIDLIWSRKINPGKVFDLTLPLDQVAEGYRAMDQRRAIKTLLLP